MPLCALSRDGFFLLYFASSAAEHYPRCTSRLLYLCCVSISAKNKHQRALHPSKAAIWRIWRRSARAWRARGIALGMA
jgi:hypothetical protein